MKRNSGWMIPGKRKGWLLLETVLSMGVFAMLLTALVPAFGGFYRGISFLKGVFYLDEECLFAEEYITDKIRHTLERTKLTESELWDTYPIFAVNEKDTVAQYRLQVDNERWKFLLYNGKSQPITGDQGEHTIYYILERDNYFAVEPEGLVTVSFTMSDRSAMGSRQERSVETAVLPLYDYFMVGDVYE